MNSIAVKASLVAGLMLAAPTAFAQTDAIKDEALQKKVMAGTSSTAPNGWKVKVNVGGTLSFQHSNSNAAAAGAGQEGATFQLGVILGGTADYKNGQHRVENSINLQHTQTKQPGQSFRKSLDNLEFLSTYLYNLKNPSWLGPFARFRANTQILPSYYYAGGDERIARVQTVGPNESIVTQDLMFDVSRPSDPRFRQTGSFEPLVFRETAGMFARPWDSPKFKLDAKLGVGSQQLISRSGQTFVQIDANDSTVAIFKDLSSSADMGAEAELGLAGILIPELLTWKWATNIYLPFVSSGEAIDNATGTVISPAGVDFLVLDTQLGLSLKLAKWLSLDYNLGVRRAPLVVDGFQVQNGILITAGFDIL